jgi:cytoskeletal protein RodZ
MKEMTKLVFGGLGVFITILIVVFILGLYGLGWMKFFKPKQENIRRQVFEETQSYVHGKTQDLAKYYAEYKQSDMDGQAAIKELIIGQFADFDADNIRTTSLRNFLINTRGY